MVSKEDDNGIVVLKWRNTPDVRILSTKHAPIMVPSTKEKKEIVAFVLFPQANRYLQH